MSDGGAMHKSYLAYDKGMNSNETAYDSDPNKESLNFEEHSITFLQ